MLFVARELCYLARLHFKCDDGLAHWRDEFFPYISALIPQTLRKDFIPEIKVFFSIRLPKKLKLSNFAIAHQQAEAARKAKYEEEKAKNDQIRSEKAPLMLELASKRSRPCRSS